MKKLWVIFTAAGSAAVLVGCATPASITRTPLGPSPQAERTSDSEGTLEVFTAKRQENNVGYEFSYNQRTGYEVYDSRGAKVKTVLNNNEKEFRADAPEPVRLPEGQYTVKALAAVGLGEWVSVPVIVKPGETTEVHLNGQWRPPADAPAKELVQSPGGFPMGWRADGQ
jgi:hypothetical protein